MSTENDGVHAPTTKPFRFKDEAESKDAQQTESTHKRRRHHRHHHSSRHRSKRHKQYASLESRHSPYRSSRNGLDPDQAFRESLFDALGDDEGANFWEGVYGQPIHKHPNQYIDEETGELETMDDEEYAQHVRRKMWEKSREGIEAEREEQRREKARQKRQEEEERKAAAHAYPDDERSAPHNNFVFAFEIEASLRRGQRRKDAKHWKELWKSYLQRWDELQALVRQRDPNQTEDNLFFRNKIAWPVESGKRKDVNPDEIQRFIENGSNAAVATGDATANALATTLKLERVRWHPDKIQQRYGFMDIDETTMKGVTATFQAIDRMWNDLRTSSKS